MPILPAIGRRSFGARLLVAGIYLVLGLGAVTMLYPFLLMLSGSLKTAGDLRDVRLVPPYLMDDRPLYRAYVEGLFNESLDLYRAAYALDDRSFEAVRPPGEVNARRVAAWREFLGSATLPPEADMLGFVEARLSRTMPLMLRRFKNELKAYCRGDLAALNRELGTEFSSWNAFFLVAENNTTRLRRIWNDPFSQTFRRFKARQPMAYRVVVSLEGFYALGYLAPRFGRDLAACNEALGTRWASWDRVRLTERRPAGAPAEQAAWEDFVRHVLNLAWVRLDPSAAMDYRAYLTVRYHDIAELNRPYNTAYPSFEAIPFPEVAPESGPALSDWESFLKGWTRPEDGRLYQAAGDALRIEAVEFRFRDFLRRTWPTAESLNRDWDTHYGSFDEIPLPQREAQFADFLDLRRTLRWEFATRNFRTVLDYIAIQGRGLLNTAIYCALAVALALLVNPLAAYALSRYRPRHAYQILLFLLLTMAFPPIVTQIPVFLMLRDLRLLNTFAALLLPGLAQGYSIFLLKGFFDSLPRELYESAEMDGAGEWTIFWHITMSLSRPVLAVMALSAFTTAYSNFMFALLICQDERMWTLMVWLYQLQSRSGPAVIYASLLIAAVPTLLIFLLCQKIILRGIVVPMEK